MAIDSLHLVQKLRNSSKQLNWILLYSEGCRGTPHILPYVRYVSEKFGENVDASVVASDDYYVARSIKDILFKYGLSQQTYIVENKYGELTDFRQKGFLPRNQICLPCRQDAIGVPYNIVYDSEGNVVYKGYRKYTKENGYLKGEDFIGGLLRQYVQVGTKS